MQFALANLIACAVGYLLMAPVRAQVVAALHASPDPNAEAIAHFMPVVFVLRAAIPALTLALCLFAVTRPRAREFMRLSEQVSEER